MAATAHTKVFWPAGSICCSDQPPASNDVESCSAPLRGLAIRYQKRAALFPRRHGLPTCENCAWGALGGRQPRARFAHLGLRTASPSELSTAYSHINRVELRASAQRTGLLPWCQTVVCRRALGCEWGGAADHLWNITIKFSARPRRQLLCLWRLGLSMAIYSISSCRNSRVANRARGRRALSVGC